MVPFLARLGTECWRGQDTRSASTRPELGGVQRAQVEVRHPLVAASQDEGKSTHGEREHRCEAEDRRETDTRTEQRPGSEGGDPVTQW